MLFRFFASGWPVALLLTACQPSPAPAPAPESAAPLPAAPNVLLIVADDLGWVDLDCYGSHLTLTPRLDALARHGVQFMQAYAADPLGPGTRTALLTGHREPGAAGLSLAARAATRGYRTFHVGRWTGEQPPAAAGFDRAALVSSAPPLSYYHPFFAAPPADLGNAPPDAYLTDLLTDRALDFLREAEGTPWLLQLSYYSPHVPLEGRRDWVRRYQELIDSTHWRPFPKPDYAAMVSTLDENVGRVVDRLEQSGQLANTLIVFTSDNGGLADPLEGEVGSGTPPTDNGVLRGGKGSVYEGGIRVPLILHFPAYASDRSAHLEPVITEDLYVTVGEALGDSAVTGPGLSLLPLLRGASHPPRRHLQWESPGWGPYPPARAERHGSLKTYVDLSTDSITVYDLQAFPDELHPHAPARNPGGG